MTTDTSEPGPYGADVPPFPETLGGRMVIAHQRVAAKPDEIPYLAVVLLRSDREEQFAYEVCNAELRYGTWCGSETEHSMSAADAKVVYDRRIDQRGAI